MKRTLLVGVLAALGLAAAQAAPEGAASTVAVARAPSRAGGAGPGFWDDSWRGWHFYDDPQPEVEPQAEPSPRPARRPAPATAREPAPRSPALEAFGAMQRRLEEYRNVAIMTGAEADVRRYMEYEAMVVEKASRFADVAQRVAWATPGLDMTLRGRPVNASALEVYDREQLASRGDAVAALARTHVVFFFFRSDCPYCHAFAPTVRRLETQYGLRVVPISVDGGGIEPFEAYRRDNGISKTLQVTQVPAVFLAEPFAGKVTPIGFGVLSEGQLLERIVKVAAPGADALAPSTYRHAALQ